MILQRTGICVAILLLAPAYSYPTGDEATAVAVPSNAEVARYVRSALGDSRLRLRSGVYRATGVLISKGGTLPLEGDVSIFCAFDYDADQVRFDKTSPIWKTSPNGMAKDAKLSRTSYKYIRDGAKAIYWDVDVPMARIEPFSTERSQLVGLFDVRLLGLFNWETLRTSVQFDEMDYHLDAEPGEVAKEGETVYRLVWLSEESGTQRIVWFDESQGMSPVRMEIRSLTAPKPEIEETVYYRSTVKWAQESDVWVPVSAVHERPNTESRTVTQNFIWESVNSPIDPAIFDLADFNLPEKSAVYDDTLGQPIRVRDEKLQAEVDAFRKLAQEGQAPARRPFGPAIIIANIVVLAAVFCWWGVRHLRRQPPQP